MRILVTGAGGFVGRHVLKHFLDHGYDVQAMDIEIPSSPVKGATWTACNLCHSDNLTNAVRAIGPEACIHLGGISHVPYGWANPKQLFDVNLIGTVNLLEGLRHHAMECRLLMVSSAQVYGTQPGGTTVRETDPLTPGNLYAVSKAACDQMTLLYAQRYGMPAMTVRPNNHIGPGQPPNFVISSLARQVRAIAAGADPVVTAGNLESMRDFTDVRDVARAYRLLLEKGCPGSAYNLGSGHLVRLAEVLDHLCRLAGIKPRVVCDEKLFRARDSSPIIDTTRLRKDTGWAPEIELATSLKDILAEPA